MRGLILLVLVGGCMLGPTDNQQVTATTDVLTFYGYDTESTSTVQVQGWNWGLHAFQPIASVHPTTSSITPAGGVTLYPWSAAQAVPPNMWRPGPGGGSCAVVQTQTTHADGEVFSAISVDDDWSDCWTADPVTQHFFANCHAADSPHAALFTPSWGNVVVGAHPGDWTFLNGVASGAVSIVIDNYEPTGYLNCNAGNPAGCPPGGAGDPETWKFYQPNGSSITTSMGSASTTTVFSVAPTRSPPDTVYIDNMMSSGVDFNVAGGRFVFGIDFTDAGPEIITNCIRDFWCFARDHQTLTFAAPRAVITMDLTLVNGHVHASNVATTFTTGNTDANSIAAGNAIAAAFTSELTSDPTIATALDNAVDQAVRIAAHLSLGGPSLPIVSLSLSGSTMTVGPGCAPI